MQSRFKDVYFLQTTVGGMGRPSRQKEQYVEKQGCEHSSGSENHKQWELRGGTGSILNF
jgi:hypothetical protein